MLFCLFREGIESSIKAGVFRYGVFLVWCLVWFFVESFCFVLFDGFVGLAFVWFFLVHCLKRDKKKKEKRKGKSDRPAFAFT